MVNIFVNLKRFDVPRKLGGICQRENPGEWIEWIISSAVEDGLGKLADTGISFLVPEALILPAIAKLRQYPSDDTRGIRIGSQGVYRENVQKGGNFGAFTTNLPAAAAAGLGCQLSIIGHSEERRDKLSIVENYDPDSRTDRSSRERAGRAVDGMINQEVLCALASGLDVLLCVGETAEERGEGSFEEQKPRIEKTLRGQLLQDLKSVETWLPEREIVIGYEPSWAIGPGKVPPGAEYIGFVSAFIKEAVKKDFGFSPPVVYGGGLKEENAGMIAGVETIDGGLVALTKFTGDIAYEPEGFKKIVGKYLQISGTS